MGGLLKIEAKEIPTCTLHDFPAQVKEAVGQGKRSVALYGRPSAEKQDEVVLTAVFAEPVRLSVLRTSCPRGGRYHSITRELPAFQIFEREIHESFGITPTEHPWLKPVRFSGDLQKNLASYPFFKLDGHEVHEVAVGPIHAGVIEPGHFRFMCLGETVHHLEIHLGFQHRGVEKLLLAKDPRRLAPLVESVAGDSSVAYTLAYARALEALAGVELSAEEEAVRGLALELERIAMHLGGLAGLTTDVAFLPGSTTYGRLRTAIINASMRVCASRFGRTWIRPGGARFGVDKALRDTLEKTLLDVKRDLEGVNDLTFTSATVAHRLKGTGRVSRHRALEVGLTGMAARMAGLELDLRAQHPDRLFSEVKISPVVETSGDCWARAVVRRREIDASLDWIARVFRRFPEMPAQLRPIEKLAPGTLCLSMVEGWRGEILHALETDGDGKLIHYKLQDPSLRNWFGLALSLRENAISDFPICNKSFDLSYCGNDL